MSSVSPGSPRLTRRERRKLAETRLPLRPLRRYRALRDVINEGLHLWKTADNKVRLAVTLLGPFNGIVLVVLANPQLVLALPPRARVPATVALVVFAVASVGLLLLAIRVLEPHEIPRTADGRGPDDFDAALGVRGIEDMTGRPLADYRRTWSSVRVSHLHSEMAAQAHAIAEVNRQKYTALERLFRGLQILFVGGVICGIVTAFLVLQGPPEQIRLGHGVTLKVGRPGAAGTAEAATLEPRPPAGKTPVSVAPRDWKRFPAVVDVTTSNEIVAVGDVHGGYDRLVALLTRYGLIRSDPRSPGGQAWTGGSRVLVSVGDLIDKGSQSVEVLDLMMALEREAAAAGGAVVVTLGNHEAEFLAHPGKSKAREFDAELAARGLDPRVVAAGGVGYGQWLRERPLAARVNSWFFAHGGRSSGLGLDELSSRFRQVVDAGDWRSTFLVGPGSILEARLWWKDEDVDGDLAALGAAHIVFGHDPGAFTPRGEIVEKRDGRLVRIDVGMSPAVDDSKGQLLVIDRAGGTDVAFVVDATGARRELWRGVAVRPRSRS